MLAPLERRAQQQVRTLLAPLDAARRETLLAAMSSIRLAFDPRTTAAELSLRGHRPGDMGWVVERHGALYAAEYGWNEAFEALVAGITAEFISQLDPARERCWIAAAHGRRLGCVFLVAGEGGAARLRLLLVEPEARGLGLGRRLVKECVGFARAAGYRRVVLWTHANLAAARHLRHQEAGFELTSSEPRHSFGQDVVSETWNSGSATRVPRTTPPGRGRAIVAETFAPAK